MEKTVEEQLKEAQDALEAERTAHDETKAAFEDYKVDAEARLIKERARNPKKIVEVEHEGKKYLFNQPNVRYGDAVVPAEEAAGDKEWVAKILAIEGQNILLKDE